jgi:hypothetical protein
MDEPPRKSGGAEVRGEYVMKSTRSEETMMSALDDYLMDPKISMLAKSLTRNCKDCAIPIAPRAVPTIAPDRGVDRSPLSCKTRRPRALATRPASIGMPGRHQLESVADITSERPAEIIGIRIKLIEANSAPENDPICWCAIHPFHPLNRALMRRVLEALKRIEPSRIRVATLSCKPSG